MSRFRLVLATAVGIALVLLGGLWSGRPPSAAPASASLSIPGVGNDSDLSSTWFCTAGSAALDVPPHAKVNISNTSSIKSEVLVSAYGAEGAAGSKILDVGPGQSKVLDLDETFSAAGLSAMVESTGGGIAVTHSLLSESLGDTVPCERESSSDWYFPSQTLLAGSTAQLVLFNPFSSDAGVDVTAAVADGIRSPSEWAGIVVPAGTTKVIDLSVHVQVRDQFSLTVKGRSGRIFAETVQTYSGVAVPPSSSVAGLRISRGVATPRSSWSFAGGFKDAGAAESLVIQNPDSEPVTVKVQVIPYGSADMAPEPFEVKVPPRRYAVLDLTEEGRVPDVGFHAINVESDRSRPVVVQRLIRLSDDPVATEEGFISRPQLAKGVAADTGSSGAAKKWWVTGVLTGGDNAPLVFIHNPGTVAVKVEVSSEDDAGETVVLAAGEQLAPSEGMALELSVDSLAELGMRIYSVEASGPVVVEQLVTLGAIPDFALMSALPVDD